MAKSKDVLDNGVSASAKVTGDGFVAKIKSRFFSAFDRYGGNLVDQHNPDLEDAIATKRAITEGRVKVINELSNQAIKQIKTDPEFARRALENQFGSIFREQHNEDMVHVEAAEIIKLSKPEDLKDDAGPEKLSDEFLDRFEKHARMASTEELRKKWGRVLAEEVKAPGAFTARALRILDEIDADTARAFEEFCSHRVGDVVPKILFRLSFQTQVSLIDAGLLLDPGVGHVRIMSNDFVINNEKFHATAFVSRALAFPVSASITQQSDDDPIKPHTPGQFAIPVYLFTKAGFAIASIFELNEEENFRGMIQALRARYPGVHFHQLHLSSGSWLVR